MGNDVKGKGKRGKVEKGKREDGKNEEGKRKREEVQMRSFSSSPFLLFPSSPFYAHER
jgi:hypothetical protein